MYVCARVYVCSCAWVCVHVHVLHGCVRIVCVFLCIYLVRFCMNLWKFHDFVPFYILLYSVWLIERQFLFILIQIDATIQELCWNEITEASCAMHTYGYVCLTPLLHFKVTWNNAYLNKIYCPILQYYASRNIEYDLGCL